MNARALVWCGVLGLLSNRSYLFFCVWYLCLVVKYSLVCAGERVRGGKNYWTKKTQHFYVTENVKCARYNIKLN